MKERYRKQLASQYVSSIKDSKVRKHISEENYQLK